MDDSEHPSSLPVQEPEENGGSVATQSHETQSHDSTELSCDPDAISNGVSPETDEGNKMTSSQKLAAFAFKST